MQKTISIVLLRESGTTGQTAHGSVISPLLGRGIAATTLTTSVGLRISIIACRHADIVAHTLVGV